MADVKAGPSPMPEGRYHAVHLTANPARTVVWRVVAAHLSPWIPPGAHVLEIGAGYCDWINQVAAARRVAVDHWLDMPRHAAPGVEAMTLDAGVDLRTLGEGRFDVALASNVLEHFEPDAAARVIGDVAAVLRPGGRFIVIQPNFRYAWRRYFDDYTHRSVFTHVSLAALVRARGFELELVQPRFLPYSMQGAGPLAKPWLVRAYLRSPLKPLAGQMLLVARKP